MKGPLKLFEHAVEEIDFKNIVKHIDKILSLNSGDRFRTVGTNWELKTAEYIAETLNEYGYKIEIQEVPIDGWKYVDGKLSFKDGFSIEVYTYAGLSGGEAEGELIYLEKATRDKWPDSLKGKIVLINLDFNLFNSHVMPALEAFRRGAEAVIFTHFEDTGVEYHKDNTFHIYDGEPWLDGLIGVVRPLDAKKLVEREGEKVFLKIDVKVEKGHSYNVIGYKEGDKPLQYILSAHHDGYNPGVMDNLSGVAYILELARLLSQIDTLYGIEVISFTAEEYGYRNSSFDYLIGSEYFFRSRGSTDYILMFNVDIIGLKALPIGINYSIDLHSSITNLLINLSTKLKQGYILSGKPSLWLDSWPAIHKGLSAISLTHLGDNYYFRRYYHTERDDISLLDKEVFIEALALGYTYIITSMEEYPIYRLSNLTYDLKGYLHKPYIKILGKENVYNSLEDLHTELRVLEANLEKLGEVRKSSRILKVMNHIREKIFQAVYRLGIDYPTPKLVSYFPEYYNNVIEDIEGALSLIDIGKEELTRGLIENMNINRWAKHLSIETVQTLLDVFKKGDNWAENAIYPYLNTRVLIEYKGSRLKEELHQLLDRAFNNYKMELTNFEKVIEDTLVLVKHLNNMVEEWIIQSSERPSQF